MKTISDVFLEVFNEDIDPSLSHLAVVTEEEMRDIVGTGMDCDCFKTIVKRYAEYAIDRCAEIAKERSMEEFGFDTSDFHLILHVKTELK